MFTRRTQAHRGFRHGRLIVTHIPVLCWNIQSSPPDMQVYCFYNERQVILEHFHSFINIFYFFFSYIFIQNMFVFVFSFIPATSISVILSSCCLFESVFKGDLLCFFIFSFLQYFISGSCACKISQNLKKSKVCANRSASFPQKTLLLKRLIGSPAFNSGTL